MDERASRNMVQRLDGRLVNAGRKRGMLIVCATGCCCGHVERRFAPVPHELYHNEWERRRLRNRVHLNMGGCLGPCPLANVALLLFDGRPIWFHSLNDPALVPALYDYIEAMLAADGYLPPPPALAPHVFNGFAWDGLSVTTPVATPSSAGAGTGILLLTQADTDLLTLRAARALLPPEFAPVQAAHIGAWQPERAAELQAWLGQSAVVVVRLLGGARSFAAGLEQIERWAAESGGFVLCLPGAETLDPELLARSNVGAALATMINTYFHSGGADNLAQGLRCLSDHLLLTGWGYDPPRELPHHGRYTPANVADGALPADAPRVGVLFYRVHALSGNTAFVDALCRELISQGLRPCAVFTRSLKECAPGERWPIALRELLADGPLDALICTLSFAAGQVADADADDATPVFAALDVPVLQAIPASDARAVWQRSGRGLSPLDTAMNVALPEFDGRIIGVPISFKERDAESEGACYLPDDERIRRLVGLTRRLVALRRKPNAEKRIAFVLTNSSAKAARVGNAVGLDAPASLVRVLQAMQAAGYRVSGLPASGDVLLQELIDRCSYDRTWLTEAQLARAVRVPVEQYLHWFDELPAERQADMIAQWGAPPGTAYLHDGALALAGQEFGNVFVALQPPRGYDMDPNAIYHRPDLPPPHTYYALYRWLRDVWRADAIVHMGKHGTLEWLPGKSLGLSQTCYPDLVLGDVPLIYPFIINDPGEGNQAKRRAHAVIVDHLTPPMTSAGAYGELAELAQLVDEYYQVEQLDPGKLPLLQRQIWQVLERSRLSDDLRYILRANHGDHSHDWDGSLLEDGTPTALAELEGRQVAHLLEDIEGYLCELTGAQIRDGLHILGTLPEGEALIDLLYHLLKLPNLTLPALPATVARRYGWDWEALLAQPGRRLEATLRLDGQTCHTQADLIAWVEAASRRVLAALAAHNWQRTAVPEAIAATLGQDGAPWYADLQAILTYVCERLVPALRQSAHDEIAHLLRALAGGFVPPGPSGAPTRGMAHVLPTGRNFYAVDPRALPSVAAWQVGQGLAEDLIQRFLREEGQYPRSVGISIWGTSAMRTYGDDIAQVLALLGVRPRWQSENRRVIGLEVVPLEELGRPRIDVVCRISGFFRDAFPHAVALLDQAARLVIERDEPLEHNFPRAHALARVAELTAAGLSAEQAERQARFRVFGCPPGAYGAGILPLIDGGNWQRDEDFARAYLTWGGYAYTAAAQQGEPAAEAFAAALRGVEVATKNQDNREHDIFDSDDYLQYHGGMIATIRALSGRNPRRYFGDSSDPRRPRTRDLREEARRVFRSRVVNPKWIASMRRHGYKGALELAATVDYLFGYDATAQVLEDWMYHSIVEAYLRDEEMQQFFADSNPWAWQAIVDRLLEAAERQLWQDPDPLDLELLQAARRLGLEQVRVRQEERR